MFRLISILFIISSCSSSQLTESVPLNIGTTSFILNDQNGSYILKREVRTTKNLLITRTKIYNPNTSSEPLETSVTVSKAGKLKKKGEIALLPHESQFKVWLEKQKFTSRLKTDSAQRKFVVQTKSPEKSFNGVKEFNIPKARYFCFFSQLPDCLAYQNLLLKARSGKIPIYIIWDAFPFHAEQYDGLKRELVSLASFYFVQKDRDSLKFELDLGNQIVIYHFDKKLKFEKLFWIAQGITLSRMVAN